ncbi:hypothetical protein GIB67_003209 [Kingdonia uniflora]|uniref:Homeobox domain-containing protein n=1 Tax=Kingdonia uniflora TaxID=39325 RepID=A0A7J7LH15_9MAGN|nr:hypothetical protein GIB67_003209 [Kingdonia uniflora]
MELGLSLGDSSRPFSERSRKNKKKSLRFCMSLGAGFNGEGEEADDESEGEEEARRNRERVSANLPFQLNLLPQTPFHQNQPSSSHLGLQWPSQIGGFVRGFDVNLPSMEETEDGVVGVSSPNSSLSKEAEEVEVEVEAERGSPRASDDDENGLTRKKLRLSKEQSAFLEESFKEHNTLNPKQKLDLAKELNLRPRQVEVWFQNRRARTKLKQTEVDCEYLKKCCETLTEENKRLQKELQELRVLKSSNPFNRQLPATTLTMCPSCEKVVTSNTNSSNNTKKATALSLAKPKFYPFSHAHPHPSSAAS